MKRRILKLIQPLYAKYHFWYHRKPRKFVYKDIYTMVQPGVFSPKNTMSTKVFLDFISTLNLQNKRVLELGCGSGIISVLAASKGAQVWASDINKVAVRSLKELSAQLNLDIRALYSDLLDQVPKEDFDYVFINPPYYPKEPENVAEKAWFCGVEYEYFEKLFQQLPQIKGAEVHMILSDGCDLAKIKSIAQKNTLEFEEILQVQLASEVNYIFKVA
ncbi:methyltransferase [bacterium SCSIO 12643]|nr:methyltransferase [bacterium SCSIO 12643]